MHNLSIRGRKLGDERENTARERETDREREGRRKA